MQRKTSQDFSPMRDIPNLDGKVIFITGGTSGLGAESVKEFAKHKPQHIYFTGRNVSAGKALIQQVNKTTPGVQLTFIEMDMTSLSSVKNAVQKQFSHEKLHVLMCNAGIMSVPAGLTKDGFEIQFGVNHLAHALLIRELSPVLARTAKEPNSDVRLVSLSSSAWRNHPKEGINFDRLRSTQHLHSIAGSWVRYGQSKLANIVYTAEFARRFPTVTAISIHPGVVATDLGRDLNFVKKAMMHTALWVTREPLMSPEEGAYNQLWSAAGAEKGEIVNGAFYMPVGVESNHLLDNVAKDPELARKLWQWTEDALAMY